MNTCPSCGYAEQNGHEPLCLWGYTASPPKPVLVPLAVEQEAARVAIKRADDNADEDWKRRAFAVGRSLAHRLPKFCSDHLWDADLEKPREARALGAVMQRLAREGFIEATGEFVKTRQSGRHAADVRVWRSLVYRAAAGNLDVTGT
jgi:hypothetical protein